MGCPRSDGTSCCSTDAKNELRSRKTVGTRKNTEQNKISQAGMRVEHTENFPRFISKRLRLASVSHCSAGFEGVEGDAALRTDDWQWECGDIVSAEVAVSLAGHCSRIFIKDCVPDPINGIFGDLYLDCGRGGGVVDDLESIVFFTLVVDRFSADTPDG